MVEYLLLGNLAIKELKEFYNPETYKDNPDKQIYVNLWLEGKITSKQLLVEINAKTKS